VIHMTKASDIFDADSREKIRLAVIEAEKTTGGEIVPVAATASGRYDRAEDIFGFVVSLVGLSAAWLVCARLPEEGNWAVNSMATQLPLWAALLILLVLFSIGAALASRFPALRLPFITRTEMNAEVERAAAAAFHNFRAHGTASRVGVLIYVSLYERTARVIADDSVADKVAPEAWAEVVALITDGMAKGSPVEGMTSAITRCAVALSGPFPRLDGDVDELSNELRIVD